MDSIFDLLTSLELSDKEAIMYMALLRNGTQPISHLSKKANLNRSTGYVILHSLMKKGLASRHTRGKVQYFTPLEPKHLPQFIERRQQQLESQKEKVQAMMGQLTGLVHPLTTRPRIEFFDGPAGARTVFDRTLQSKEKLLCAFLSVEDVIDFVGADYWYDYTKRRIASGYTLQAMRTKEKDEKALKKDPRVKDYKSSKKEKRVIRYIKPDMMFAMTMYLYDDTIAIISSKEEGFAMTIQSKELSQILKSLFGVLWKTTG